MRISQISPKKESEIQRIQQQTKIIRTQRMGLTCSTTDESALELTHEDIVVQQKLLASTRYKKQFADNEILLQEFVTALSTTEGLKSKYLTTNWMNTMEMCHLIEEHTSDENERKGLKKMFQSESEPVTFQSQSPENQIHDLSETQLTMDELSEQVKRVDEMFNLEKNKIRIKLVVTEVPLTNTLKNIRKVISPVIHHFPTFPEFGMFHAALVIGPWYIDWNNSELCIPRKCVSNASFLSADIDAISSLDSLEDTIDKVSKVIIRWNTTMSYVKSGGEKGVSGNCQDFVDELFEVLDIRPKFTGPMNAFLKRLKRKGVCDLKFEMSEEFRRKFSITDRNIVFSSHQQLDQFVNRLLIIDAQFEHCHKEEWFLLKSFDRGFWLRKYYKLFIIFILTL
jgi:hypothetical protein